MKYIDKIFKKREPKVLDYQVAYERQKKRSDMLMSRVENLKQEQVRRDQVFYETISALDPHWHSWHSMTRAELGMVRRDVKELFMEMRPLMGCENIKYGISNIAQGFSPDGESQLDMVNKDIQNIRKVAVIMQRIMFAMDWEDD
jgi:hypothetical protein